MPLQEPVYKRERANRMYTPFAYYFGRFTSHAFIQSFYPFLITMITVYGLGIDTSPENVGRLLASALLLNFTMTG